MHCTAVLLRRSLVDKQMVDTEATIRSYEEAKMAEAVREERPGMLAFEINAAG